MNGAVTPKLRAAFGATLFGLAAGAVVAGVLSAILLMLGERWSGNPSALFMALAVSLLAFSSSIIEIVTGAVLYLLAPGFVLFAAYALRPGATRPGPSRTGLYAIAFTLILFIPLFFVGYRSRVAEGLALGAGVLVGVRAGLWRLDRRLSGRSPEVPRLPKGLLFTAAAVLTLMALVGSVWIVEMLRHPSGIGMEWIVAPLVGLTVVLCLGGAVALVRRAGRQRPAIARGEVQRD